MKLSDVKAVVTGGASGLGLATVERILSGGGKAAILDCPNSEGAKRAQELGKSAIFAPADVTKEDAVTAALDTQGRAWRSVFDNGNIDVTTATVRTDLAVTAWLACTVPSDLDILGSEEGLPELPPFAITLHLSHSQPSEAARELARHLRAGWQRPRQAA